MFCYIHIPFCENRCKYCRFASFWISQDIKVEDYTKYLLSEIKNTLIFEKTDKILNKQKDKLKSIYLWGWTPSILNLVQLKQIFLNLKQKFVFDYNIEITLETTPNQISLEKIITWQELWINRISIWVQTLNKKSLKEIWREEKWDILEWLNIINSLSNNNFTISIDFIIWLPYVKLWEIKENIKLILDKYDFITHISVYMLEDQYYPKTWKNLWIKEDEYLWEYIEIKKFLGKRWFFSYEISNFAKSWYECKHNKAYWNHSEMLAFWLWSHWFLNGYRYENFGNFKDYYKQVLKNTQKLNKNDIFLEKLMFWLRTKWLEKNIFGVLNQQKIRDFVAWKYLKFENNLLKIEDKWILVIDYILGEII